MNKNKLISDLTKYVTALGVKEPEIALTIVHDVLLDPKANSREFKAAKYRVLKLFSDDRKEYRNLTNWESIAPNSLQSKLDNAEDNKTLIDIIPYDNSNERASVKLENQRQLIKELLDDADERTTTIVLSWLECDKPNFALVGNLLGIPRKNVERSIKRLFKKFDTERFGSIYDYLTI